MPWVKVGETTFNISETGSNQNVNLPGSPQTGDIVIYAQVSDYAVTPGVVTSGYTDIYTNHAVDNPGRESGYKIMGATPDTIITFNESSSGEQTAGVIQVWRGVHQTTPIDATPTTATGTTGMPNPPSYNTVTDGALVIIIGFLDDDNVASAVAAPSGYTNLLAKNSVTSNSTVMIASKEKSPSGTEDPAVFTATGGDDNWAAVTFALRPAAGQPMSLRGKQVPFMRRW